MKFLFLFFALLLTFSNAMHNGEPADHLPYYIYLTFLNQQMEFFGGGALISSLHVLTCAANIQGFTLWRISMGSNRRSQHTHVVSDRAVAHPNYGEANNVRVNDIGIIFFPQPVTFSASVFPIAIIPMSNEEPPMVNVQSLIMGFGANTTVTNGLENLSQGHVRTMTHGECNNVYAGADAIQHFCAVDRSAGSNFCLGDQGGPVTMMTRGREFIVGIQSLPACNAVNRPSLYMRITPYREWVMSETGL